ncbi:MAG: LysM peptidoglycan-binding domain-containing protein [Chloroflexota bacterium]
MRNCRHLFLTKLLFLGIVWSTLFVGASSAFAGQPFVHVVGWGDTLYSIATRHGTTVHAIMQANNLRNPDFVFIGQRLSIPNGSMPGPLKPTMYVVQQNDTLFSIATRHGTTVSALMQANGLYNYWIYVGQVLKIPGYASPAPVAQPLPHNVYHIVRPGDYLASIATRYRSTPYSIQIANKLSNPSFIWTGQKLYIPDSQPQGSQAVAYSPLPSIYIPQPGNPPAVVQPAPVTPPVAPPVVAAPSIPNPYANTWEAVLTSNTVGTGPCSLAATVVGKTDWPVVVATPDGSWISDAKYTGTKPERGPYVVEFAHACTGVWRVIPLGLNIYADVELHSGHAEVEFRPRYY